MSFWTSNFWSSSFWTSGFWSDGAAPANPLVFIQRGNSETVRANNGDYYYTIGINSSDSTKLTCVRSADPTSTIGTAQDATNEPTSNSGDIQAFHYDVADNKLHVVFQQDGAATEDVFYSRFDMTTNTWVDLGTSDYEILIKAPDAAGQVSCMVAYQYTYMMAIYADVIENVSGNRTRVGWSTSVDGGVNWIDRGYISGGGGTYNEFCGRVLSGSDGVCQAGWINDNGSNYNVMMATVQDDFTLQAPQDTGYNSTSPYGMGWPGGVSRINYHMVFPYNSASGNTNALFFDSTTAVTSFDAEAIGNVPSYVGSGFGQAQVNIKCDQLAVRAVAINNSSRNINTFIDPGNDLWVTGGTLAIGTYTFASFGVYDHEGPKLALNYAPDSGEPETPLELAINSTITNLSDVKVGSNKAFHGPFLLGGSIYAVMRESGYGRLTMMKADNLAPDDSEWTVQDTALHLSAYDVIAQHWAAGGANKANGIRSIWCVEVGTTIHVYGSQECGTLTRSVFDTATDTWTTRLEHITNGFDADFGGVTFGEISAGHDSTSGFDFCVANYHDDTTPYAQNDMKVRVFYNDTTGWANQGNGGGVTVSTDYQMGDLIGPDTNGDFTLVYNDVTNYAIYGRLIENDGTINAPFSIDAAIDQSLLVVGRGAVSGDTIYIPYVDADNYISRASFTAAISPTVSITTGVSLNTAYRYGDPTRTARPQPGNFFGFTHADSTLVLSYVASSDQDIWQDAYTPAVKSGVTVTEMLSSNYMPAEDAIGLIYDNSDTASYAAYTISTSTAGASGTLPGSIQTLLNGTGGTYDITLINDTWIAAGTGPIGTTVQSDALVNAMTSAQVEAGGWNAQVRDVLDNTDLTRVSDTVARLTVPATVGYVITANEEITTTIPNAVLSSSTIDIVGAPFTIFLDAASASSSKKKWIGTM